MKKTMFGADKEADEIMDKLPRCSVVQGVRQGALAAVFIDAAGKLQILIQEGGLLSISERNLAYVHGDVDPFMFEDNHD